MVVSRVLTTSREYCILVSTLRNHLFGNTIGRKREKKGVLTPFEEEEVLKFVEKMASEHQPSHVGLSLARVRIKVLKIIQERPTPRAKCLLNWTWVRWFRINHSHLTLGVAQELEIERAWGLCPGNV